MLSKNLGKMGVLCYTPYLDMQSLPMLPEIFVKCVRKDISVMWNT